MNQPPSSSSASTPPPSWRRPRGVAVGTWQYVNQRAIADRYDQFVADTPLCFLDQSVLDRLFPPTDQRSVVLDLGCGSGRNAIPLAARGYQMIGVDLSQSMLSVMMKKQDRSDRIMPIRTNLVELDCFADHSADHAICMFSTLGMIKGAEHRRSFLDHVHRIVRPEGRFVVHVHNRWAALRDPKGIRSLIVNCIASLRSKDVEFGDNVYQYRGLDKMFMHRFSQRELSRLLNECGWATESIMRISLDGSTIIPFPGIAGGYLAICNRKID